MSAVADYTVALLAAMTPELKRRIDIIAERERKTREEVMVEFLIKGANTPIILGAGVSTQSKQYARSAKVVATACLQRDADFLCGCDSNNPLIYAKTITRVCCEEGEVIVEAVSASSPGGVSSVSFAGEKRVAPVTAPSNLEGAPRAKKGEGVTA